MKRSTSNNGTQINTSTSTSSTHQNWCNQKVMWTPSLFHDQLVERQNSQAVEQAAPTPVEAHAVTVLLHLIIGHLRLRKD